VNGVVHLAEGGLVALCNPYRLDGNVTTHPREARGWSTMDVYLLRGDGGALLIDAGMSVHRDRILEQLATLLEPDDDLSLCPLRLGEFAGICNIRPIVERFRVSVMYGTVDALPSTWADLLPAYAPTINEGGGGRLADVRQLHARSGTRFPVGRDADRMEVIKAPLRLLPGPWLYDRGTRTLFTSDVFGWLDCDGPGGPWQATGDDVPERDGIRRHLVDNKYWWLAGARTDQVRYDLDAVFETHDVHVVAPGFGRIIAGSELVEAHRAALDDVLREAASEPAVGIAVGRRYAAQEAT
jgi:flavorubredoxin